MIFRAIIYRDGALIVIIMFTAMSTKCQYENQNTNTWKHEKITAEFTFYETFYNIV